MVMMMRMMCEGLRAREQGRRRTRCCRRFRWLQTLSGCREQLTVQGQIGAVTVPAALGGKGCVAAVHSAAVQQTQVHILIVQLHGKVILKLLATVHTAAGILLVQGDVCVKQLITIVLTAIFFLGQL